MYHVSDGRFQIVYRHACRNGQLVYRITDGEGYAFEAGTAVLIQMRPCPADAHILKCFRPVGHRLRFISTGDGYASAKVHDKLLTGATLTPRKNFQDLQTVYNGKM